MMNFDIWLMSRKKVCAYLLSFLLMFIFCFPAFAGMPAGSEPLKEITVVLDDNYPPYIFRDENRRLQGILVDEWHIWEEKTGIKVTLQGMDWEKALTAMANGKAQVIDTIFYTGERARTLDYTAPYNSVDVCIFFRKDISGIKDFDTLHGFTIGVKAGDADIDMLKKHGIDTLQEYPSYESIVQAAKENKIKIFCIDSPPAFYFLTKMNLENEFKYTAPLYTGRFHRAVPKGRKDLLEIVEGGFAKISSKEYKNIEKKWLGSTIPAPHYLIYIFYALGLLVVLGGITLFWNYLLRRKVAQKTIQINEMVNELRENETRLRGITTNIPGLVFQLYAKHNGEYGMSYVSERLAEIYGLSEDPDVIFPALLSHIYEEDCDRFLTSIQKAAETCTSWNFEGRIVRPSGELHWIHGLATPSRNEDGVVFNGILLNITGRKQAEEALLKSYATLKGVLESPKNVVIFALDRQYRYIAFNKNHHQTMRLIWGADIQLGSSMLEYIKDPEDCRKAKINFDRALSGESFILNEQYGDTALERRYYEDIYNPIIDENGDVIGLTLFLTDITEQKKAEDALQSKTALLEAQTNATIDGILVVDQNNKRVLTNQRMTELFNIPQYILDDEDDAALLRHAMSLTKYPEKFLEKVMYLYDHVNEVGQDEIEFKSGMILDRYSAPVLGKDGKFYGRIWTFHDITEPKRAEEERLKIQKLESLGVLAGGIAHDFNNLLTGIMGNISIILSENNPAVRKKLVEETIKATKRATNLTQKLLAFAKGGIPEKKIGSVSEIIQESADFSLGKGSLCRCEMMLPDDLWFADMDSGQIGQVIQNLVINANQAMPEGGIIWIKAENIELQPENIYGLKSGIFVHISISDEGIGIPQKYLSKIFDPYFTTKQQSGGGSGLGLAVANAVINNHKGAITVESEQGKGATFHVFLPAVRQEVAVKQEPECVPEVLKDLKILVMDDEAMIRDLIKIMIEKLGCQAEFAENGLEALSKYSSALKSKKPFDLVILDLTIPGGMGGVETLEKLHEIDPGVAAIISSGYSNIIPKGFIGVLVKPYTQEDLRNVIGTIFRS
jgi:PAS domain S-box-containing protein